MASYLYVRAMEVTDDITRMAIDLIHRLDIRSEKQIHREFLADLKRVDGKMQILSRVAEAVVEQPDGIVREVIFSQVKEETFHNLVTDFVQADRSCDSCARRSCSASLRAITGACCPPYWKAYVSAATIAFSR
jgi:hypothetical protein